ncbi:hypothetical protein EGW08_006741 [Elysia chlorotica]|uniref:Sulfotransferase domain-containing protein n=1 Tax=Elysia chlorotica TaxID=188477 RepID=A0A3S1BK08_ELYCH|nr:hypothetical protein EGW08_006741 [Elysia chlorotica]
MLRLQEGMYSVYLKDWIQVFPKTQIILVSFEHYIKNKGPTMSAIFSFLELDPAPEKVLQKLGEKAPANTQNADVYNVVGSMLPKTRKLLEDFYKPFQDELFNLIESGAFVLAKDVIKPS